MSGRRKTRRDRAALAMLFDRAERLRADGAWGAAESVYGEILEDSPRHLAAMRGRAAALEAMGRRKRAAALYRKANRQEADNICDIAGKALVEGRLKTSLKLYRQALEVDPGFSEAVWGIAESHHGAGRRKQAIEWYQRYLELEPDEPEAMHMLASLGVGPAPEKASDDYVVAHFDRFAEDFDKQLLEELDYKGPELLQAAVAPALDGRDGLDILDLGCGTGLVGKEFAGRARRMDGVDLSSAMLARARRRRLYDRLEEDDIVDHLRATRRRYDLVVAGDALIYFGALDGVFAGVGRVLKPGGLFALTLEADHGDGYRLTESGRYAHGHAYMRAVATAEGFVEIALDRQVIRNELGSPVEGDIWVFRGPSATRDG